MIMPSMPVSIQKRTIFSASSWNAAPPQSVLRELHVLAGQIHARPLAPIVFTRALAPGPELVLRRVVEGAGLAAGQVSGAHHEERVAGLVSGRRRVGAIAPR